MTGISVRAQELCESRGERPGLRSLTVRTASVDKEDEEKSIGQISYRSRMSVRRILLSDR